MKRPHTGLPVSGLLRVSGLSQATEGYGLDDQEKAVRACAARRGFELISVVVDPGISGKILDRPAVREILELLRSGAIRGVVTPKIDRLGRKAVVILGMLQLFEQAGAEIFYADMDLPEGKTGRFLRTTMAAVAELDWENITERLQGGRDQKLEQRQVPPSQFACFGYRMISKAEAAVLPEYEGRDGQLRIIAGEAAVVREVFRRFVAGESLYAIAAWGNECGIRLLKGGTWRASAVSRMLRQTAYAGEILWGTETWTEADELTATGKRRRINVARPEEEWRRLPCLPLVDAETWAAAQSRLAASIAIVRGRPSFTWLLRGCVSCGVCTGRRGPLACRGLRPTRRKESRRYEGRYYQCTSADLPDYAYCRSRVKAETLEALAWERLNRALQPGEMARLVRAELRREQERSGDAVAEVTRWEEKLADLVAQEARLLTAFAAGFSMESVKPELQKLQQQRAECSLLLAAAQARLPRSEDPEELEQRVEAVAAEQLEKLAGIRDQPAELQRMYQFFVRATIFPKAEPDLHILLPLGTRWAK